MVNQRALVVVTLIMALGAATGFGLYFKVQGENDLLTSTIDDLESHVAELQASVDELRASVNELEELGEEKDEEIATLSSEVYQLNNRIIVLTASYQQLESDYSDLKGEYDQLWEENKMLHTLNIGNSLTSYYDALRYEFGPSGTTKWWNAAEDSCIFAAQLALHDLHELYWIKIEETYGEDVGEESYKEAYEILKKAIEYCEINSMDSDTEKIDKILDFITLYVDYEPDLDDSLRAPVETLSLRSGDCDDFSILAAAMFEKVGIQSAIAFFQLDDYAHAMILVHMDELDGYQSWGYDNLTKYDLEPGRWTIIDPQLEIELQGDDLMSEYKIYMAVEVDYEKVS